MNLRKIEIIFFIILGWMLVFSNRIYAYDSAYDSSTTIENISIDMIVKENNVYDIHEIVTTSVEELEKGIYQKIPLVYEEIENGKIIKVHKKVETEYNPNFVERYKDCAVIDLLYNDEVDGKTNIFYQYDAREDVHKGFDLLKYSLLQFKEYRGTKNIKIKKVSFRIVMPKPFEENAFKLIIPINSQNIECTESYSVDGNLISGYVENLKLEWGQGLDVSIQLPEGYFIGASDTYNIDKIILKYTHIVIVAIFMLFTFISTFLCVGYLKTKKAETSKLSLSLNRKMIFITIILVGIRPIYQYISTRGSNETIETVGSLLLLMVMYLLFIRLNSIYFNIDIFRRKRIL